MVGALERDGQVIGILADSLERTALQGLFNSRLVLISPYDPGAGFQVGHAMQRNKYMYALANAALVVNSDCQKGRTWAGAVEQLERLHFLSCLRATRARERPPGPQRARSSSLAGTTNSRGFCRNNIGSRPPIILNLSSKNLILS